MHIKHKKTAELSAVLILTQKLNCCSNLSLKSSLLSSEDL